VSGSEAESEANTQRIGQVLKGRYRIERALQLGADNTVYVGTDEKAGRVAIKVLDTADSSALRRSYLANAVGHPSAVNVLDTGTTPDGAAFLVMELLEAKSVRALLADSGGRLPVRLACHIADQALDLLGCAHAQGIVHGEIGLDTLFVTRCDQLKVLGFGKQPAETSEGARAAREPTAELGAAMASDVFALTQTLASLLRGESEAGSNGTGTAPARIAAVLDKGLSPDVQQRWASASEMRAALQLACQTDLGRPRPKEASMQPPAATPPQRQTRAVWLLALTALFAMVFLWRRQTAEPPAAGAADQDVHQDVHQDDRQEHTTSIMAAEAQPSAEDTTPALLPSSADTEAPAPPAAATLPVISGSAEEATDEGPRRVRRRGLELPPVERHTGIPTPIARDLDAASVLCAQLRRARGARSLTQDEQRLWSMRCEQP
jgi:hypothetical protein